MGTTRILRFIHFHLLCLQRKALKKPGLWLVGLLIVIMLSIAASAKLKMLLSIDDLIDPDFKTYSQLTNLNKAFSDKNNLFLVISPRDTEKPISKAALCAIQKWIYDEVDGKEDFRKILTTFGARRPVTLNGSLRFPPILELNCETTESPEVEAAQVRSALQKISASPWGLMLTSKSANDVALNFYLNDTALDTRFGAFDTEIVGKTMKSFDDGVISKFPELRASWAGVAAYQYYLKKGFDQTNILNLAMALLILVLFWFCFSSFKSGFLFLFTIIAAIILIFGGLALSGCPIDVLTNTLSLMLILSSLEDFLFLVNHAAQHSSSWRRSFRKLLMPGFFTSLTSLIGFGSLALSNLGIIRRFGAWAGGAALIEWVMIFLFLPAFLQRFPRWRSWLSPGKLALSKKRWRWFEKLGRFRLPRLAALALLSVYFIAFFGLSRLRVADAPTLVFPQNHPARQALSFLETSRGWQSEVSLVFPDFYDPKTNIQIIEQFAHLPNVAFVESPYRTESYLTDGLEPMDAGMIRDAWRDSPAASRLISPDGQARAILYVKDTDTVQIDRLIESSQSLCPLNKCHLAGTLVSYAEFGDRVLSTLFNSLAISLGLVSVVILFLMSALRLKHRFAALVSAMWGPFSLLCIFCIFKLPVTYVTSTFASILVGLAGDNTIQYLFRSRSGSLHTGIRECAGVSVQVTVTMAILSLVLLGSYFAPLRTLGLLFILGFALSLVGDLWILRGLLSENEIN